MKILVVISNLHGGGAERVLSLLSREWAKSHRVVIVLFNSSRVAYNYGGQIVDLRIPASHHPLNKVYNIIARSARLTGLIRHERPDRIISFMESANFPAVFAAALAGCLRRLWVSVRNNPMYFPFSYRILIPWVYRLPDRVISVSEGVKRSLESMGVPAERISTISNPVIIEKDLESEARESAPPVPIPYILGVGRLEEQKGFDRLLKAFSCLNQTQFHLVILGQGMELANLFRQTRELGVEDRVHFLGWIVDVDAWYRHAECFVLSSRFEGYPNVLIEAMANDCPVVSFDCPYGPVEIIEDNENGLLVSEGDIDALAEAISRVLNDQALRRELIIGGMKSVKGIEMKRIAARWLE